MELDERMEDEKTIVLDDETEDTLERDEELWPADEVDPPCSATSA